MNLLNSPIVIVGFGSQAKAWALNLKDSKAQVLIALNQKSQSKKLAMDMGFKTIDLESNDLGAHSLFVLLIPDDQQANFLATNEKYLKKGAHLVFAHGYAQTKFHLEKTYPQFSHSLLAPKAIASEVRFQYESKGKIGAAFQCSSDQNLTEIRELAKFVGFTALYQSTYEEECNADLFSEQSLLCSILPYVSLKSYNTLRKNGVSKEIAFMECFLELKSISEAIVKKGPIGFFNLISPNALIGSQKGRKLLLGEEFDRGLEKIVSDILDKKFYKEVEVDANALRASVIKEWEQEELSAVFEELKKDLIN